MRVLKLFIKAQFDTPRVECQSLQLLQGCGIQGDRNAQVGSPRQVLLVDQPTLQAFGLQPGDLQENILIDAGIEAIASGQILQIGAALIRPTFLCEPCAYLETLQKGLAKRIKGRRGWLGMVVRGGAIAPGNPVTPTPYRLPPLTNDAKGRFHEFVSRIPTGKVVTTADLILALGVSNAHYRTIPALIKKAPSELPVHRIVAIDRRLLTRHIPNQAERLATEGVELQSGQIGDRDRWQPEHFHPSLFTSRTDAIHCVSSPPLTPILKTDAPGKS